MDEKFEIKDNPALSARMVPGFQVELSHPLPKKGHMRVNVTFSMEIPIEHDSAGRRISPINSVAKYIDPFCCPDADRRNFPLEAMREHGYRYAAWKWSQKS
jgi:hypothetical protein